MKPRFKGPLPAAVVMMLCACAASKPPPVSLYERLGGEPLMTLVITRMLDRTVASPLTGRSFDGINIPGLRTSLITHLCAIAGGGGGCVYEGETMARAHQAARITSSEFDATEGFMREELDSAGVDTAAKNDLLRLMAPMKRDIVSAN